MANLGVLSAAEVAAAQTGTDWSAVFANAIPALVQARYQDKVLKENLSREKAGLPLLNTENYQPGVKVGIDPQTRKMVLIVGGLIVSAALVAFLISQANKKKGRK